jgi:hypothetical protein
MRQVSRKDLSLDWPQAYAGVKFVTAMQVLLAASLLVVHAVAANAASPRYSKELQRACASDYRQYCGEYGIETAALRLCMNRVGHCLTNTCINALVAAGEVSQSDVNRRKRAER